MRNSRRIVIPLFLVAALLLPLGAWAAWAEASEPSLHQSPTFETKPAAIQIVVSAPPATDAVVYAEPDRLNPSPHARPIRTLSQTAVLPEKPVTAPQIHYPRCHCDSAQVVCSCSE